METVSSTYGKDRQGLSMDDKIASLFQPDTLAAAQYFENFRRKSHLEPERRLMLAVFEDAVQCFQNNLLAQSGKRRKLFEEAEQWILEIDDDWFFSFESICEALGLAPEYVRQGLIRWKEKKLSERPNDGKPWERKKMAG